MAFYGLRYPNMFVHKCEYNLETGVDFCGVAIYAYICAWKKYVG